MNLRLCLLLASLCAIGHAGAATDLSEQDYFTELPEVLTVTRLAQPISETPGAVTIIDRETIRRSGARELVDVLRLVPGYWIGGYNGAQPSAAYHAPLDDFGVRNLVLIDGRSVYSAYQFGDTHHGMMGLLLEDIERIEVLRGANSAAYGANAMFGVINIITRHTADTRGAEVSVTGGQRGVWDNQARIGWGEANASFRLSTGRRSDSGYGNAYDDKIVSQLHFRGDLRPAVDQELMLAAGIAELAAGGGFASSPLSNPERTIHWRDYYLHGVWQKQLSATDQIKLTASIDEETFRDAFYQPVYQVDFSSSGRGRRFNLEFQHQLRISSSMRAVWGVGHKYEEAVSLSLYNRNDAVSIHEERLFGNLEWRPHTQWVVNAGGFLGSHNSKGSYFSPRLMANFQVAPGHTLRAGMTESTRMPTLFELKSDFRLYPPAWLGNPYRYYASTGNVAPEKLHVQELGYFANVRDWRMTLDVRAYVERMRDMVGRVEYPNPTFPFQRPMLFDFSNRDSFKIRGVEYQLRWKPLTNTEIWVNQAFTRTLWDRNADLPTAPTHATTLALFQKMPYDLDLGLMYHSVGAMTWNKKADTLPRIHRLDARLAFPFRFGITKAEAAFVVQAANGSYPEYQKDAAGTGVNFMFERRAFGTLRLEF
jgi:iron complex outermembrane receptor protein